MEGLGVACAPTCLGRAERAGWQRPECWDGFGGRKQVRSDWTADKSNQSRRDGVLGWGLKMRCGFSWADAAGQRGRKPLGPPVWVNLEVAEGSLNQDATFPPHTPGPQQQ